MQCMDWLGGVGRAGKVKEFAERGGEFVYRGALGLSFITMIYYTNMYCANVRKASILQQSDFQVQDPVYLSKEILEWVKPDDCGGQLICWGFFISQRHIDVIFIGGKWIPYAWGAESYPV